MSGVGNLTESGHRINLLEDFIGLKTEDHTIRRGNENCSPVPGFRAEDHTIRLGNGESSTAPGFRAEIRRLALRE